MSSLKVYKSTMLLILCASIFCSSKNIDHHIIIKNKVTGYPGDIIGRKVIMPDTFEIYSPFNKDSVAPKTKSTIPLKIYAYVNVSCPTCVVDLANWQEFISEDLMNEVPIIMVCTSKDHFEYFKYLCEAEQLKHFTFPLFLDIKNQFPIKNPFVTQNPDYQTVLTNADNKILVSGDPLHSENTRKLYIDEIKKFDKVTAK